MSKILAEYSSSRNPATKYQIVRGGDGVTYCTCPGWRFNPENRECKHLRDYFINHKTWITKHSGKLYTADLSDTELQKAIEEAVAQLTQ